MKSKTRKILTRVGSALMLGMSLFNLGALWSKQSGGILPRRSKLTRKQKQEQIGSEQEQIAQISQEEAVIALQETLQEEQAEVVQQQQQRTWQRVLTYGAVGAWTVLAGLFFTSVVFNQPFGLGKGLLALLPGQPHLAAVSLQPEAQGKIKKGQIFELGVNLTTQDDQVGSMKLILNYDPQKLKLVDFILQEGSTFEIAPESHYDKISGQGVLALKNLQPTAEDNYRLTKVARVKFVVLDQSGIADVSLNLERSLVLKPGGEGRKDNILGKVSGVSFLIE